MCSLKDDLDLLILRFLLPKSQDYKYMPSCSAEDQTKALVHTSQVVYQLSCICIPVPLSKHSLILPLNHCASTVIYFTGSLLSNHSQFIP